MNIQRFILGSVAVFVFIAAYEWIFHGIALHDTYMNTASLWRSEADMQNNFHWLMIGQLFLAVMFCFIFIKGYEDKGLAEGLSYGIFIGLLVFVGRNLIMYAGQARDRLDLRRHRRACYRWYHHRRDLSASPQQLKG